MTAADRTGERPESGLPAPGWLELVEDAERRGELLLAVDLAERGLAEHPEDRLLQYKAVLALARSGSTAEAARRFAAHGLEDERGEDIASLGARIAKDEALAAEPPDRGRLARRAGGHLR